MADNYTSISHLLPTPPHAQGARSKESEPFPPSKNHIEIHELVEHDQVPEDVKPHVAVRPETIKLAPEIKELGVQATGHPVFATYQSVKVPLADDKIMAGLKAPVTTSLRWLAELAQYLLALAHIQLKIVGGKVTRILKK